MAMPLHQRVAASLRHAGADRAGNADRGRGGALGVPRQECQAEAGTIIRLPSGRPSRFGPGRRDAAAVRRPAGMSS